MTISGLGEFGLIERLAAALGRARDDALLLGIGDDAAAWLPTPGRVAVATADTLVEGVHFDLSTTDWRDLGWKALAENLSDVAAMGCVPRYALVGLGLPGATPVEAVEDLYGGLGECGETFGCHLVGGDTVSAPFVVISVSVFGESGQPAGVPPPLLTRAGGRPGDQVAVTGPLGGSAAGLRLLLQGRGDQPGVAALVQAHRRPVPRVSAGLALVGAGVRCAIDISDGLMADLGHVCERSDVDAEIDLDRVPVHPAAQSCFGDDAIAMALTGGEDYELLCTGSTEVLSRASKILVDHGELPLTVVGSLVQKRGQRPAVRVSAADGRAIPAGTSGYEHFRRAGTLPSLPSKQGRAKGRRG